MDALELPLIAGNAEGEGQPEQNPVPQLPPPLAPLALEVVAQAGGGGGGGGPGHIEEPLAAFQAQPHPPQLFLRRSSVSSLDESSQRCPSSDGAAAASPGGGLAGVSGVGIKPSYSNPSHASKALEGLRALQKSGNFTDVTLVAGDAEVSAHKSVLAACSPYFYAMFTGFEESRRDRVTLSQIDPDALATLVDYVYTGQVDVTEENVQMLLTVANILQLDDVRDGCCEFLQSQLHPTNCLGIKAFANLHGCVELHAQAVNFIECRFAEVLDCDEFVQLNHEQVIELIRSDGINVSSEEKVYESVLAWAEHDPETRRKHLSDVMAHVRFPLMDKEYIFKNVPPPTDLFDDVPRVKDYVIEALKYHLAHGDPPPASSALDCTASERARPRAPVGLPKVMLAIGGQAPKAIRSVECYDFKEERWFSVTEMEGRRCRCGVAVVRGRVYAVGGFNGSLRVRTVDEFDPERDCWRPVASMEARRSTLGVAVVGDSIYAVGGFDGSTGLNSAEVLDLSHHLPRWRPVSPMSTRRSSVGVGVLYGLIYAVGGYDGNSRHCLSSVEVYNPERDSWSALADMTARRSGAGVGVLNGLLFAVGGHDGPLVRKSVECYNPEKKVWTQVADMRFCRRNAGVVTHGGLLYVVGGDDGTSNLQSVEVYNCKTNTWSILPGAMSIGRSYTGVCIIDKPESF